MGKGTQSDITVHKIVVNCKLNFNLRTNHSIFPLPETVKFGMMLTRKCDWNFLKTLNCLFLGYLTGSFISFFILCSTSLLETKPSFLFLSHQNTSRAIANSNFFFLSHTHNQIIVIVCQQFMLTIIQTLNNIAVFILVHGFDEFHCRKELHPPILFFTSYSFTIEAVYILNRRQKARRICLNNHIDEDREKVISCRHLPVISHTQQVHDAERAAVHTLHLVFGSLQKIRFENKKFL